MKKKMVTVIISLVIIITGVIGFARLRYWERSVWIFKSNNDESIRGDRFSRGGHEEGEFRTRPEDFRRGERNDFSNLPDSVKQRIIEERDLRTQTDSLRQGSTGSFPDDRGEFRERRPDREGRGGHDFRRGSKVQLKNVFWFLTVFAGLTVLTIYSDRLSQKFLQRNKKQD